ncbi:MAG: ferrous iron transport protein B [Planctomycetes bacterium]|nr:ferrous iron transport protein B [Planctomycetota bacterium]
MVTQIEQKLTSRAEVVVAIAGNPNCGKSTLFNALTGLSQKIANYAGVTVEKKVGIHRSGDRKLHLIDLPGMYALSARSLDERVALEVVLGLRSDTEKPDGVITLVDASNLERNLFLATQIIESGAPTVVALNMMDIARKRGIRIDSAALSEELGVPVVEVVATRREGIDTLVAKIFEVIERGPEKIRFVTFPDALENEIAELADVIEHSTPVSEEASRQEAARLLLSEIEREHFKALGANDVERRIADARARLENANIDWRHVEADLRYQYIVSLCDKITSPVDFSQVTPSDRIDRVVTHRIFGPAIFIVVVAAIFQLIFAGAEPLMDLIDSGMSLLSDFVKGSMAEGALRSLITDGIIAGVGGVVIFLPQIFLLMLVISLLEDTGYMARAAFILDRMMKGVGLHGRAFIPLMSSFACAIPGIMASRTIDSRKDRLVTILIAPLMVCSARLPVYALLIAAFVPASASAFGYTIYGVQGLTLFFMYALGVFTAVAIAFVFKRSILKGRTPPLILEMPPYRIPKLGNVLRTAGGGAWQFLKRVTSIILAVTVLLWLFSSYPVNEDVATKYEGLRARLEAANPEVYDLASGDESENESAEVAAVRVLLQNLEIREASEQLEGSYLGRFGKSIEPALEPLGYDWKIGVGIVASFAAREVFVAAMGTVYSVAGAEDDPQSLGERMKKDPRTGEGYTLLTAISLLVFYAYSLMCASTIAIIYRETAGWKWPAVAFAYTSALAYFGALIVYQGGLLAGMEG